MSALELADLNGKIVKIHQSGRPEVINFWATWCPPCRAEMAGLNRLHREMAASGLAVLGISADADGNLVREFVLQQEIGFPILWDREGNATRAFGIHAFPTTLLVRRDGTIADVLVGERDWNALPVRDAVRALLL